MPASGPIPRRRLGVAERRAAILAAARLAFAESAYADVGVPAVAAAAGGSPALVFHYFGSKAGLFEAVLAEALDELAARQAAADAALPPNTSARDRVRTWVLARLDHVAAQPRAWASGRLAGEEPAGATALRDRAREASVAFLAEVVGPTGPSRRGFALIGFLGFLDRCCLAWADAGCADADRWPLVEACLGALEGALGDWGR